MQRFTTVSEADVKVLSDAKKCLQSIKNLSSIKFSNAEEAIHILQRLRAEVYEDINQIQHEYLIVKAIKWLTFSEKCPKRTVWSWNPRQTGTDSEPDLKGIFRKRTIIAAEITASPYPKGHIDVRMRLTLAKLAKAEGQKYYFVRTPEMEKRANSKVVKANWPITVVCLS